MRDVFGTVIFRQAPAQISLDSRDGGGHCRVFVAFGPGQTRFGPAHHQSAWTMRGDAEPLHRQRVQHFVAEYDAAKFRFGRLVQPDYPIQHFGRPAGERLALAVAQFAAQFQNGVALRQRIEGAQFQQQVGGHDAGTGAEFQDLAAAERR